MYYVPYSMLYFIIYLAVSWMNKHAISTFEGVRAGSSVGTALAVKVVDQGGIPVTSSLAVDQLELARIKLRERPSCDR